MENGGGAAKAIPQMRTNPGWLVLDLWVVGDRGYAEMERLRR